MATLPEKKAINETGSKNEKKMSYLIGTKYLQIKNSSSLIVLEKVVNNKANRKTKPHEFMKNVF